MKWWKLYRSKRNGQCSSGSQWFILLIFSLVLTTGSYCQAQESSLNDSNYTYKNPSRDGIGKIFHGREISHVMGHRGSDWLDRPSREQEERTDLVLKNLTLSPTSVVADIGAGSGYYSLKISRLVPRGKVLAVDIQPEMMEIMQQKIDEADIQNIKLVLSSDKDPKIPSDSVDLVFMSDVYHEFAWPAEMLKEINKALKPNGKVVLLEYRKEDPQVPIKELHKMSEKQAVEEFKAAGFSFIENKKLLPWQHFLIFRKR